MGKIENIPLPTRILFDIQNSYNFSLRYIQARVILYLIIFLIHILMSLNVF